VSDTPTPGAVVAALVAAALGALGAWLSWGDRRPVETVDGQSSYITESLPGLEPGLSGLDPVLVALLGFGAVAVTTTRYTGWRGQAIAALAGAIVVVVSGSMLVTYWVADQYVLGPGLALLLAGGLLLGGVAAHERFGVGLPW